MRKTNVSIAHECPIPWAMSVGAQPKRRGRPPAPVDPDTPGGRLRGLRERAGLSQDDLALVLRVDRSMVSKYEDGRHDMSPEALKRAADRFDVTPAYILFGEATVYAHHTAGIVGRVGAGAIVEAFTDPNPELIEVPSDMADSDAFRVVGDSCVPVFEDGDIVVVRRRDVGEGEFLNRYCVVETEDGAGYLKLVTPSAVVPGSGRLYDLESPNPAAPKLQAIAIRSARPVELRVLGRHR